MVYSMLVLTIFPAFMLYAGFMDLATMTIPNKISLGLLAGFIVLVPFSGLDLYSVGIYALTGFAALALGIFFFAQGWVGGGDAKLFAATALWLGPFQLYPYGLMVTLLGGGMALLLLQMRRYPLPLSVAGFEWVNRLYAKETGIPYGVPMAVGALLVFPETIWITGV